MYEPGIHMFNPLVPIPSATYIDLGSHADSHSAGVTNHNTMIIPTTIIFRMRIINMKVEQILTNVMILVSKIQILLKTKSMLMKKRMN